MNILEIDCVSYATRVGYSAAAEFYNLLKEDEGDRESEPHKFLPADVPDELEDRAKQMGEYICLKGCETGERLFRWMDGQRIYGRSWQQLPAELVLTFETFVQVCSSTYTKLHCRQIEAERHDQAPPAPEPLAIEDTIFEPIGSLGEMLPHAVEALNTMAEQRNKVQENIKEVTGLDVLSLGETVHSSAASDMPGKGGRKKDLPPAPKTPAQRKTASKAPKSKS